MPDPSVDWLSHVALLLALAVPVFASLAALLRHLDDMLDSVLSMCALVRRFRCEAATPATPRKRVDGRRAEKKGSQGRGAPTQPAASHPHP